MAFDNDQPVFLPVARLPLAPTPITRIGPKSQPEVSARFVFSRRLEGDVYGHRFFLNLPLLRGSRVPHNLHSIHLMCWLLFQQAVIACVNLSGDTSGPKRPLFQTKHFSPGQPPRDLVIQSYLSMAAR